MATSAEAFTAVARRCVVLVALLQSLPATDGAPGARARRPAPRRPRHQPGQPRLAVFFVALPQFVPGARARRAFVEGPWLARVQRLTGAVLVGLGVRLAFERR